MVYTKVFFFSFYDFHPLHVCVILTYLCFPYGLKNIGCYILNAFVCLNTKRKLKAEYTERPDIFVIHFSFSN